jgi:hypothetical protein
LLHRDPGFVLEDDVAAIRLAISEHQYRPSSDQRVAVGARNRLVTNQLEAKSVGVGDQNKLSRNYALETDQESQGSEHHKGNHAEVVALDSRHVALHEVPCPPLT